MVRYLDYNEFLDLIGKYEVTMNFRCVKDNDLDDLFEIFSKNSTLTKEQVRLKNYKKEIITITDFEKLRKGDIILISNEDKYYLSIIEEVLYNEI